MMIVSILHLILTFLIYCYLEKVFESSLFLPFALAIYQYSVNKYKIGFLIFFIQLSFYIFGLKYICFGLFIGYDIYLFIFDGLAESINSDYVIHWRPYEKEIRKYLFENDPSLLHRVDDLLDKYRGEEKNLLNELKHIASSGYSSNNTPNQGIIEGFFLSNTRSSFSYTSRSKNISNTKTIPTSSSKHDSHQQLPTKSINYVKSFEPADKQEFLSRSRFDNPLEYKLSMVRRDRTRNPISSMLSFLSKYLVSIISNVYLYVCRVVYFVCSILLSPFHFIGLLSKYE